MSRDTHILRQIIQSEGSRYTHSENDPPTKYGITLPTLRKVRRDSTLGPEDVKKLTAGEAIEIYRKIFVRPFQRVQDADLRYFLVDSGVQHGVEEVVKALQDILAVKQDGRLGPVTAGEMSRYRSRDLLIRMYKWRLIKYARTAQEHPEDLEYLKGWMYRMGKLLEQTIGGSNG